MGPYVQAAHEAIKIPSALLLKPFGCKQVPLHLVHWTLSL